MDSYCIYTDTGSSVAFHNLKSSHIKVENHEAAFTLNGEVNSLSLSM